MGSSNRPKAEDYFDELVFENAVKYDVKYDGIHKTFGTVKRSSKLGGRMLLFEKGSENHYYLSTKEGEVIGNSLWLSKEDDEVARGYFTEYYKAEIKHHEIAIKGLESTIDIMRSIEFVNKGEQ